MQLFPIKEFCFCNRWDACWTDRGAIYGWNFYWFRHLNNVSNCQLTETNCSLLEWNCSHLFTPTGTRDLQPFWWYYSLMWWSHCVPRSPRTYPRLFWIFGLQMSWKERCCWLSSRGNSKCNFLNFYGNCYHLLNVSCWQNYKVTSKRDQEQYWTRKDEPYRFVTVREFVEAFQSFHVGRRIEDELSTPFDKSKSHPAALATKKYGVGKKKEILKSVFFREWLLMKRNYFSYIFRLVKVSMHINSSTENGWLMKKASSCFFMR